MLPCSPETIFGTDPGGGRHLSQRLQHPTGGEEVLSEVLGYSWEEIGRLREEEVI